MAPDEPPVESWPHSATPAGELLKREPRDVIVFGAALGGLIALCKVASGLPREFEAAILIALDIASQPASSMLQILGNYSQLPVGYATHGASVLRGRIVLAPCAAGNHCAGGLRGTLRCRALCGRAVRDGRCGVRQACNRRRPDRRLPRWNARIHRDRSSGRCLCGPGPRRGG
ncbi:hypothetical protein J7E62_30880 [Variovorax paradoxus]|nr:hypothetical protein [Variovorax paradoxus]